MNEYIVTNQAGGRYRILAGSAQKAKKTACHLDGQTEDNYIAYEVVEAKRLTKKGVLLQQNSNRGITEAISQIISKTNIPHTRPKSKGVL